MTENRVQITDAVGASLVGAQTVESGKMKVALATSTTPAATGRRSRGMVTPCGLRLDGVVKVQSGKLIEIFRFAQNDIFAVWARSLQRGRCRCCRSLRLWQHRLTAIRRTSVHTPPPAASLVALRALSHFLNRAKQPRAKGRHKTCPYSAQTPQGCSFWAKRRISINFAL